MHPRYREKDLNLISREKDGSDEGWLLEIPSWHPHGPNEEFFADIDFAGSKPALEAVLARRYDLFTSQKMGFLPPQPKYVKPELTEPVEPEPVVDNRPFLW